MIVFNNNICGSVILDRNPVPPTSDLDYLYFQALEPGATVSLSYPNGFNLGYEYSTDGTTWNVWDGSGTNGTVVLDTITLVNAGDYMFIRNVKKSSSFQASSEYYMHFELGSAKVLCGGNIMSLISQDLSVTDIQTSYQFANLFRDCTSLVSAPTLPSVTLYPSCYETMFLGCTSLLSAPALPATATASNCYCGMFSGCTSLVSAPELPATSITAYCYESMFENCVSLKNGPRNLPGITLSEGCYSSMFSGCISMVSAPALGGGTATACYKMMFKGCSSLTSAPTLGSTIKHVQCYESMFEGCSSLVTPPQLKSTSMYADCYKSMFKDCVSLTTAPGLPAETLADNCYYAMFQNCILLQSAPELPATDTGYSGAYSFMFDGCASLSHVKVYATIWTTSNSNCWLRNVSSDGTFEKPSGTTIASGDSGIPNNWTVQTF